MQNEWKRVQDNNHVTERQSVNIIFVKTNDKGWGTYKTSITFKNIKMEHSRVLSSRM